MARLEQHRSRYFALRYLSNGAINKVVNELLQLLDERARISRAEQGIETRERSLYQPMRPQDPWVVAFVTRVEERVYKHGLTLRRALKRSSE